jgi:hypothetical protein
MAVGVLLFLAELFLFLGTGVLQEDEVHFLSGEGSWEEAFTEQVTVFSQEFVPMYRHLSAVSFRMDMSDITDWDGQVIVSVEDAEHQVLFEETKSFEEIVNCAFTDVETDLELSKGKTYYLNISCVPSAAGEYPAISVCSRDYKLWENRTLSYDGEKANQQLVSRYHYEDAVTAVRKWKAILLCMLTALGILFGIPANPYVRKGAGIAILVAAPCVLGRRLELLNCNASFYLPFAMRWNVALMYALELIVLLCTHSPRISIALTNIVLTALYSANYFMNIYRGTSLRMNDLTAAKTAARVVGEYDLTPNSQLAMAWGVLFLIVVFAVQTGPVRKNQTEGLRDSGKADRWRVCVKRLVSYAVTISLAVAMTLYGGYKLLYTDLLNQMGFMDLTDTEELAMFYEFIYYFDGYLVATCIEVKNSRIEAPENYSVKQVEEILEQAAQTAPENEAEDLPHVILIMNESFSDLQVLTDLELNQDNLPFWRSMKENAVKGYVNASGFGGGTANSEFEVLTGCSMAFFSTNYYPYQQAVRGPLESMVSQMKENGYTTVAMHPESATNWNRENVYRYYGFDKTFWKQDFADAQTIHSGVSDAETYNKIIELYEQREPGERLFVFDLTMQNHGGYTQDEAPYAVTAGKIDNDEVNEYLSLIKISDEAFSQLVDYFEQQDEKVVICMFGDHQPWIADLVVDSSLTYGNEVSESMLNKYKTPFVIWANYDIPEADGYDISMNYLGGLLLRTAGIPMSPFFDYLEELRGEYPIITANGYVDSEGSYSGWSSAGERFWDYRMLQYNYLFDDNTVEWGY